MDRPRNLSGGTPAIELPGLRFALGEDIDMLRAAVRGFAQAELAPRAAEIDRSNQFPSDLWRKMGALGLLGVTVEEAYGGTMMGYAAHIVAMEEISRASASVGLSYGAHSNLCVNQIRRNGTDRKSTRLNSSHITISYAVFCLKKKKCIPRSPSCGSTCERHCAMSARE